MGSIATNPAEGAASGPHPDPAFSSYAQADPELRKLIERELERGYWDVRHQVYLQWTGLFLGFVTAMAFLAVSAWLISGGQPVAGTILGSVDLVALVTVFVVGRRS
jgi:hypothetical protein